LPGSELGGRAIPGIGDALQRDHLRGAALDVYVGEFEHMPMSRLWSEPSY
jgi:hypothetical protein